MRKQFTIRKRTLGPNIGLITLLAGFSHLSSPAEAGFFNLSQFVEPGDFSLGVEPEVILTSGAGIGIQAKYSQGLNDLMNLQVGVGTGGGPRRFRAGSALTFDFFPDIENQPGIGIATQGYYVDAPVRSFVELKASPYLHKTFEVNGTLMDPFLAVPVGVTFYQRRYESQVAVVVGSNFKATDHLSYTLELGIAVANTESYFSGGLTFYP